MPLPEDEKINQKIYEDKRAAEQNPYFKCELPIQNRRNVMLDKSAFVARFAAEISKVIFERGQRARKLKKFD